MKPTAVRIGVGAGLAVCLVGAGVWMGRALDHAVQPQTAPIPTASTTPAIPTTAPDPAASAALVEAEAQERLNSTSLEDFFKSMNDTNSAVHEVRAGENLTRIAKQFGVTPGLVQAANFLKNDRIFPGQKLRIPQARLTLLVDKSQNTLYLKADQAVLRTYRIATGKDNSTPEGSFKIINHLKNPAWYYDGKKVGPDSPDNPLGTRWMGFDKEGYGLHGTSKPEEIGQFATLGCVRMLNADIEPLFELVPDGAEVTIIG